MLFDANGKIKRYESPEDILTEFFNLRLEYYERRRVSLLQVRACVRVGAVVRDSGWRQGMCEKAQYSRRCSWANVPIRESTVVGLTWPHAVKAQPSVPNGSDALA